MLGSRLFNKTAFDNEAELEKVVSSNPEAVFDGDVIYIPQQSMVTAGGSGTIPDGIVIDLEAERWYIVEAELAEHDTWHHIVPQVSKQIVAADNYQTKNDFVKRAFDIIKKSEELKKKFTDRGIPEIEIHRTLEKIIENTPVVVIAIDVIPADLTVWARTQSLARDVVLLTIEKYAEDGGKDVAYRIDQRVKIQPETKDEGETPSISKLISEHEFLKGCEEPNRVLYERLKAIAKEKGHELRPGKQAFSYYVTSKGSGFCLLTLWSNSIYLYKSTINAKFPPEAAAKFRDEVVKIRGLQNRYDTMKQPGMGTRKGEISEYEIEIFISAFKNLLNSIP